MRQHILRTFQAFRYRDFRLVWIGAFTSTTGTWMQTVAQSWVVLQLTDSAFWLGVDAFLATLPMILFSLVGGAIADRVDRKKLLLASQFLQMSFAFVLAALILFEVVEVWHILVLSFLTGSAQAFGGPAYQALLPTLVEREDVPNAIALNSMQFNLARMIGPLLAAVALAAWGAAACFGLNGLSFIAVIVMLLMVSARFVPERREGRTMIADIREGFGFMEENPHLIHLSAIAFAASCFGIPLITLLPVVAKELFQSGVTVYSWLMTASGAGSVAGALVVAAAGYLPRKGRLALFFQLSLGVFLLSFAFSRNLWLSLALLFCTGASLLGVIAMVSSLIQLATAEAMRGRVMSIFFLAFRGAMPLGNLLSGWIAERWSVTAALTLNATCLALVALGYLLTPNRVREM
ncbi:MAG TPA: MFS transporter [Thermoanaerobaculia bacterium]|nr:MFS transporter [Thermoanaerobaculia bacterium]